MDPATIMALMSILGGLGGGMGQAPNMQSGGRPGPGGMFNPVNMMGMMPKWMAGGAMHSPMQKYALGGKLGLFGGGNNDKKFGLF